MPTTTIWSHHRPALLTGVIGSVLILATSGCNWFVPLAFLLPEPKRTVPAEFAHLRGSATVLFWAPLETIYEYRNARLELAAYLVEELEANLPEVRFTEADLVEDHLRGSAQHAFDPVAVGQKFGTQFVLYLELLEFSFREYEAPDLLRGRIRCSLVVYDISNPEQPPERYEMAPVHVIVPEDRPLIYSPAASISIKQQTYLEFAGTVAKKFYEHEELVE